MRKILVLSSFALLAAAPLAVAQTPAPGVGGAKATQTKESPPPQRALTPLEKSLQEAVKLVAERHATAAVDKLRAIQKDPAVTPPMLSLIGALYVQLDKPQEALAVLKPLADREDAEPAVLYNAGQAALMAGQVDAGQVYLTRSVIKEPASPAARELGMLTARRGHLVEAYSMLRPWVLRNPSDSEARLVACNLAVQLERGDDALQLLSGLSESEPAIRLLRGKALVLKKDGPGAVALLKPLLASHPQGMDLEVRRSLAEAQLLAGQPAEAIKLIDGKTAGRPALVLLLARAQRKAGNAAAAAATLKPLVDKLPANADAIGDPRPAAGIAMEYGALLVEAGKPAEAVPFYQKSTGYYPGNPETWKGLARTLDAAGRKPEAQKALAQAAEAAKPPVRPAAAAAAGTPKPATAAPAAAAEQPMSPGLQKAMELIGQGKPEPALAAIRQEAAVSKDPRVRLTEVRILLSLKRPEEALKAAEAALATAPNSPDYLYLRGVSHMALQHLSSAEQDFRKALLLQPRHLPAMDDLAVLLLRTNKKDEARKLLQQVLQINPQDKVAAANLERLNAEGKP
ncbi:MAG TPA: tetratricopeptide repeat protein [Thermoanaerobaculia bacterium]|jgi:Flp pilus assembly protein TadD|nr:tetratricopeptide repeat protein [Thermoanaerobaculia bacterium]